MSYSIAENQGNVTGAQQIVRITIYYNNIYEYIAFELQSPENAGGILICSSGNTQGIKIGI